jgi:hypothetical protein
MDALRVDCVEYQAQAANELVDAEGELVHRRILEVGIDDVDP